MNIITKFRANLKTFIFRGDDSRFMACSSRLLEDMKSLDFKGVDFIDADFEGVDLRGANLEGADLVGADLRLAELENKIIWSKL